MPLKYFLHSISSPIDCDYGEPNGLNNNHKHNNHIAVIVQQQQHALPKPINHHQQSSLIQQKNVINPPVSPKISNGMPSSMPTTPLRASKIPASPTRRIPRLVKQTNVVISSSASSSESGGVAHEHHPLKDENCSVANGGVVDPLMMLRETPADNNEKRFHRTNLKCNLPGSNHMMSPSVRLKNNLNVLKSPKFLIPLNSREDDF